MNCFSPACVYIMPMLGKTWDEYPRFRDCFVTDDNTIAIYTRVGGNNRNTGFGEEKLYEDPNFIKTYDDDYDSTYATYEFKVPDRWKSDFDKIIEGNLKDVSNEYVSCVKQFYPKLAQEGTIDKLFR